MSALTEVTAALKPLGFPILGRLPGNITGITLVTVLGEVEHATGLPMQCRNWTVDVLVLSPIQDPAAADLNLEDAVDDVLDAVDAAQPLRWGTCQRIVLEEDYNAIRVPVEITMQPPPDTTQEGTEP